MTREQRKQQRRRDLWCLGLSIAIVVIWAAVLLSVCADAAYSLETMPKTDAVTGTIVWAWLLTSIAVRLDTPRRKK